MGDVHKLDFKATIERAHSESEKRDLAECEKRGITREQLEVERAAMWAESDAAYAAYLGGHARESRAKIIASLPITDEAARLVSSGNLESTEPLDAVRAWLAGDKPILVMAGSVGRGKTVAAAWACVERRGMYFRARSFERLFAQRYGDEAMAEQDRVLRAGLVVVDDIGGREDTADGLGAYLLDLVDERQSSKTRTLLITNLPRKLFAERYPDARLHSRLNQSATWAVSRGDDLRGAK